VIYVADSLATENSPLSIQLSSDLSLILDDSSLKVKKLLAARQSDACSCGLFVVEYATTICSNSTWTPDSDDLNKVCPRDT
jgi:hypothetical protein